ncbi:hypothetical protein HanXRQr2_Chr15g0709461 [Helianthus annuus]|uniref:Uncharacterized protein n=1 Tax=Helianthus annuus TaxID=4232 RepID=A0A9K3H5W3_HELAN|nr:hypothetical protein HanXRQr2_Chr15g0709461 [Helianthus annuus]
MYKSPVKAICTCLVVYGWDKLYKFAQVNTFNLFSLYGLGVRYIKYRLVGH